MEASWRDKPLYRRRCERTSQCPLRFEREARRGFAASLTVLYRLYLAKTRLVYLLGSKLIAVGFEEFSIHLQLG